MSFDQIKMKNTLNVLNSERKICNVLQSWVPP
jgi:hypothetical protein